MDPRGITRLPVFDRNRNLFGYELRIPELAEPGGDSSSKLEDKDLQQVVGDLPSFLPIAGDPNLETLQSQLPAERTILLFRHDQTHPETLRQGLRNAAAAGFGAGVSLEQGEEALLPAQERLSFVRFTPDAFEPEVLDRLIAEAKRLNATLVADNVHTQEAFQECLQKGFQFFQGQFFTKPVRTTRDPIPVHKATLMRLYRLLQEEEELDPVEAEFKKSPDLSLRLLRLINSAAMPFRKKVESIRRALVLLGRRNVRKWVAMLLYTGEAQDFRDPLLAEAGIRARMMEQAARKISHSPEFADTAHITGTLSVVEALLHRPMDQVLQELQVEEEIVAALLRREGSLGSLLGTVEGVRQGQRWEGITDRPLALDKEDLVFYEQKATLEQAMLELDNR